MKLSIKNAVITGACIALSAVLGVFSLYVPKAQGPQSDFSAVRASEDIREIAKEPHSVKDPEALARVREYLLGRLTELGLETEVTQYDVEDKYFGTHPVHNIAASIDGKHGKDGSYILVLTHYDSSPKKRSGEQEGSRGAADAGYGVATLLELARYFTSSDLPMENGIKFLITDAEETGLLGAKAELEHNIDAFSNVSMIVNLEARGIRGPSMMFETNGGNHRTMELYSKANYPVSYSLAADVYRKMPNGTDLSPMLEAGFAGMNFAVLNSLNEYHTPMDNYDNISLESLQHYGEQVLPIVKEFATNPVYNDVDYFKSGTDDVFFTIAPNVMIRYTSQVSIALFIITLALIIAAVYFGLKKKALRLGTVGLWMAKWLAYIVAATALGLGTTWLAGLIAKVEFSLTYMPRIPFANAAVLIILLAVAACGLGYAIMLSRKKGSLSEALYSGMLLNFLIALVLQAVLPGGTFLYLFPAMLCAIALIAVHLASTHTKWLLLLPIIFCVIIFTPILYLFNHALTIGALVVLCLLLSMVMCTVAPCIAALIKQNSTDNDKARI